MRSLILLVAAASVALTACQPDGGNDSTESTDSVGTELIEAAPPPVEDDTESPGDLAGSSWRLVQIMSMDDTTLFPEDPNAYTLEFGADGQASMRADCNRGTGTWQSESATQLTFGPVASTRALCPPGSISESYLAQFEWVRSYTMRDGNLFLATMADGSIIEFEPSPPVVASVFGEPVRAGSLDELQQALLTRVFDHYAEANGITAEPAEVDAYLAAMQAGMAAEGLGGEEELSAEERAQLDTMRRNMGTALIRQWKLNKSLYESYGGRLIYQQLGPEPLDAYRTYLEERQAEGDLQIHDADMAQAFWDYFTNESRHDFMPTGSEDEQRAFSTPPWEQAE